jgi:hypothetical protein
VCITLLSLILTSCFFKQLESGKIFLNLLSTPYEEIVVSLNGTTYLTGNKLAITKGTSVTLQVTSPQLLDRSNVLDGEDTRLTFERWSTGATSTSLTLTASNAATVTAIFSVEFYFTANSSVTSTRSEVPVSGWYASGTTLELEAPEIDGKQFSYWTVNGINETDANPAAIVIDSPKSITAVYEAEKLPPTDFRTVTPTSCATQVEIQPDVLLLWNASTDPQGGAIAYDVYLGSSVASASVVARGIAATFFRITTLEASTTYYWWVVANNNYDLSTKTDTVAFSTIASPPSVPVAVYPANGQTNVPYFPTLSWQCDGATEYDLYYGITGQASQLIAGISEKKYALPALSQGATYQWKIVAKNGLGTTESATWQFSVSGEANPPAQPHTPSPVNATTETDLSLTLSWEPPPTGTPPFTYDVYFGKAAGQEIVSRAMSLFVSESEETSVSVSGLDPSSTYIWQVVAKNPWGIAVTPIWSFTTKNGLPKPTTPSSPSPQNGASDVPVNTVISWAASQNGTVKYDFYFGSSPAAMNKIASNLTSPSYTASGLSLGTTYYWKVIAKNDTGEQVGPVWSFKTEEQAFRISLVKTNNGEFAIQSSYYFELTDTIVIEFESDTFDHTNLVFSPTPLTVVSYDSMVICLYDQVSTTFSHFSPSNLTLATATSPYSGSIKLAHVFHGANEIPISTIPVALP